LDAASRDIIKLGTGLVATMAALVLGLLIGTAKSSFDAQRNGFQRLATDIVLLDRTLAHYGTGAEPAREQLAKMAADMSNGLWPSDGSPRRSLADDRLTSDGGTLLAAIQGLSAQDEWHKAVQSHAAQVSADLARQRWELSQPDTDSLPIAFLVVLAFWLFVLFTSFGLFSPANVTVVFVLFVCAMSVAGAVLLIVDLDQPFDGLIRLSDAPFRDAQTHLNK
jgi:hypothetical protein